MGLRTRTVNRIARGKRSCGFLRPRLPLEHAAGLQAEQHGHHQKQQERPTDRIAALVSLAALLDELFAYVEGSDDHPLVKAWVIHYQIATIHPFEDGNGRTARLMSGYYLDLCGYGFGGMG